MTQCLNKAKVDSLDEEKMIKIFKTDLNIDMPNLPKDESKEAEADPKK